MFDNEPERVLELLNGNRIIELEKELIEPLPGELLVDVHFAVCGRQVIAVLFWYRNRTYPIAPVFLGVCSRSMGNSESDGSL